MAHAVRAKQQQITFLRNPGQVLACCVRPLNDASERYSRPVMSYPALFRRCSVLEGKVTDDQSAEEETEI